MKVLRRTVIVLIVLAIGIGLLHAFATPLGLAMAKRVVERHLARDALAELPDGLHAGLCGAGSPGPIRIGVDGDFVSLPVGSADVIVSNRLE
jgi:ribonuclease Z